MTSLRKRMIDALELCGMSPKTIRLYVDCVARFAAYSSENPTVQEPQRSQGLLVGTPGHLPVLDQIQQILLYFIGAEFLRDSCQMRRAVSRFEGPNR